MESALKVNQKTIAQRLGISQQAVSKALKGAPDISEKVRLRVIETCAELGYRTNRMAKSLVEGTSNVLGVIFPSFSGPYFLNMLDTIEEEASRHGYRLLVKRWSKEFEKDDRYDIDYLLQYSIDGLIICPRSILPLNERSYPEIAHDHLKVVTLLDLLPNKPCISTDDSQGVDELVTHLIQLGHREIAYIGPMNTFSLDNKKRVEGYKQALKRAGLRHSPQNLLDNTKIQMHHIDYVRHALRNNPNLTAFVCFEDKTAIALMKLLRKLGLSIPQDISVTGYGNNLLFPEEMSVPLTTVSQNEGEIGRTAINSILSMLKGDAVSSVQIPVEIIIRKSTSQARKGKLVI